MAFDFSGKRVLVTGAGKGIGRALTIALHNVGCHVYAVSRTESTLVSLKEECSNITTIVLDISRSDEVEAKLKDLEAMDGVVNNAGMFMQSFATRTKKQDFEALMGTNVWAGIQITQIFAEKMIATGKKGSIVNVSSILSQTARHGSFLYCTAKAALDMVSKQFALELGQHDIRVNSINPTLVMTDIIKSLIDAGHNLQEEFQDRTPRGRIAELEEVVNPIMYLLSDLSTAVTGSTHIVDCGFLSTYKAPKQTEGSK